MKVDLAIVGGGILGSFHAYHALRNGLTVKLFEQHAAPQGATVRNFGQVVPSGMDTKWQQIGRRSLDIYKSLQQKIDLTVKPYGSVYLASNEDELSLIHECADINKSNGYSSYLLSKEECLDKYPGLKKDYCWGGLFFPEEITIDPRQMIHRLQAYMKEQLGLSLHYNSPIQELVSSNETVTLKDNRNKSYEASKAIICNGSEFKLLYPEIFEASELELVKLQMLLLGKQPSIRLEGSILTGLTIRRYEAFSQCPSWEQIKAKEDSDAFWKKWGIHILFKQTDDHSIILGDSHEYAPVKQADSLSFDSYGAVDEYILKEAAKIFQLENWEVTSRWTGTYCQGTKEDIFQREIEKNIHIITGIGGKGMTGSPGFAEQSIAQLFHFETQLT